jgi:hypothetical protein
LAAEVAELQRALVARGSALEWLANAGVFGPQGAPADIRNTVWRLNSTPNQWATINTGSPPAPFAIPTGAQRWQAVFELLKRDATAALPEDLA